MLIVVLNVITKAIQKLIKYYTSSFVNCFDAVSMEMSNYINYKSSNYAQKKQIVEISKDA